MACAAMSQILIACDHTTTNQQHLATKDLALSIPPPSPPTLTESKMKMELNELPPVQDKAVQENQAFNTEDYDNIIENEFLSAVQQPLSTFSIDVDRASYSNVRRLIESGQLPPRGAVRIEEMINYFDYKYGQPGNDDPIAIYTEVGTCPWNEKHKLVNIGLQGKKISANNLPASNLTFLIDVSGSMDESNKLPLIKQSLLLLTDQLRESDKVAIVVYAGSAGLVLPPTSGSDKMKIKNAIDDLKAGGSTAGGEGIELAYKIARESFVTHGNNRVILATDGDFNVGASSDDELVSLIEKERNDGIYLSVLGYGMGNYKDNKMEQLADKGNGNNNYIDNLDEARKVLVNEFGGTLFAIANDVKLQVEFNPAVVNGYRLIGYENRKLQNEDFNDDKKDAGEIGSGHTVTALYEIIPAGVADSFIKKVDGLKYQKKESSTATTEIMTIKLRYKLPGADVSKLITYPVANSDIALENTSKNYRFAAAVAEFGLLLRQSSFKQNSSYDQVINMAATAIDKDENSYRKGFIKLVEETKTLPKDVTIR